MSRYVRPGSTSSIMTKLTHVLQALQWTELINRLVIQCIKHNSKSIFCIHKSSLPCALFFCRSSVITSIQFAGALLIAVLLSQRQKAILSLGTSRQFESTIGAYLILRKEASSIRLTSLRFYCFNFYFVILFQFVLLYSFFGLLTPLYLPETNR